MFKSSRNVYSVFIRKQIILTYLIDHDSEAVSTQLELTGTCKTFVYHVFIFNDFILLFKNWKKVKI